MENLSDAKNKYKYRLCIEVIEVAKEVDELNNHKEIKIVCEDTTEIRQYLGGRL